jgi:hypothetical protein
VAKVEGGHRDLDAAEFLFIPEMLNFAILERRPPRNRLQAVVELADVLPETGWVAVTKHNRTLARALRQITQGQLSAVVFTDLDVPLLRRVREQAQKSLLSLQRIIAEGEVIEPALGSDGSPLTAREARRESAGEAEQKAARKLGIPAATVALTARKLWGHGLTSERDDREAAYSTSGRSPRQLQALRGRITRGLLDDLRAALAKDQPRKGLRASAKTPPAGRHSRRHPLR